MKNFVLSVLIALTWFVSDVRADYFVVPIKGVIDGGLAAFVHRTIEEAEEKNAESIIFHIDTPGGRVDSAVDIKDAILNARIPTIAFVDKNAISAGALISFACDSLYMSTGASIGAATAVDLQGKKASEKIISYFRAVDTIEDVVARVGGKDAKIVEIKLNWAEYVVRFLTHPIVSSLLMSIGFLGLLVEIKTPGWGIGGTIALVALALFFGSHYIVQLAGIGELLLFTAGLVLLTLEVLVIPGFGIAGIAGITFIVVSLYFSLVGRMPETGDFTRAVNILGAGILAAIIGGIIVIRLFPRTPIFNKLTLGKIESTHEGFTSAETSSELVGAHGVTLSDLRPAGKAEINNRRIDVVTEGDYIGKDTDIVVIEVRGSRIVVSEV